MLDGYNQKRDGAILAQLRTMYRARPFTKAIPFQKALPTDDSVTPLWVPNGAYFEAALLIARCDVAGIDLNFVDTNGSNPFLFAMLPTTSYQAFDLTPGYRSQQYSNALLGVTNPAHTAGNIKGVWYGWEVNPDGYYR